jgi:hypothetical protein
MSEKEKTTSCSYGGSPAFNTFYPRPKLRKLTLTAMASSNALERLIIQLAPSFECLELQDCELGPQTSSNYLPFHAYASFATTTSVSSPF